MVRVAFAVAANKWQSNEWWSAFAREYARAASDPSIDVAGMVIKPTALPDHNKNQAVRIGGELLDNRRGELTDVNRNQAVQGAEELEAEYIYWWDDDTVHPPGTLQRLLSLDHPFVSGVYYLKRPPCHPVAYRKQDNGSYAPVLDFRRGELLEVDSVGMGCALVAREVYQAIRETHDVYLRDTYSLLPLPKAAVEYVDVKFHKRLGRLAGKVVDGHYIQRLRKLTPEEIAEHPLGWPYYAMEYARTEDHHFCELAARAGYRPLLDTGIDCQHWGERPVTRETFLEFSVPAREAMAKGATN